ncbi:A-kinase anchor protein 8-like isoform X1 [Astyanax mexicanus]|uniref:A-kinase anchor protein 8-like isoform X1 n=1 Tax=Astyanax mexicanus TaxID=7994 RepID=UPI0020CB5101|nr:A-kinase anchor protein 8-like isoform X1 [Astyanax mexicanus]
MAGRSYGSGFSGWRGGRGSGAFTEFGGGFNSFSQFGSSKMRSSGGAFSSSGWGSAPRSQRRGGPSGGYGFGFRQDSFSMGGRGGHNGGQSKPPSLLSHRVSPWDSYQGSQDFKWQFGGGRRSNRRQIRKKPSRQEGQKKKRKQSESTTDEPDSKMGRTETDKADPEEEKDETSAACCESAEGNVTVLSVKEELALLKKKLQTKEKSDDGKTSTGTTDGAEIRPETMCAADQSEDSQQPGTSSAEAEAQSGPLSIEEELAQLKAKLQGKPVVPTKNEKKIRGFFEMSGVKITAKRISFACSVCKYRTFYSEEMTAHLESRFHKDIFKFLSNRLTKGNADFLQEYLNIKHKNMEKTVSQIKNHDAAICQLYKERDQTRDIGMEHFIKKVDAAHCAVCDMYIPMQYSLIQRHLRSHDHNYNRRVMMEESKKSALTVARSILNHKPVREKLDKYLKGENPFTAGAEDHDHDLDESLRVEASESDRVEDEQREKEEEEVEVEAEGGEALEEHEEHEEENPEGEELLEGDEEVLEGEEALEGEELLEGEEEEFEEADL